MIDPPVTTPAPDAPPLVRRAVDLRTLAAETWDVVIVGGGIVGSGALLDAVSRGMRAALDRTGRHRGRDLLALLAAHPWRPALPGAVPVRARARGARRAVPPADPRAAPRPHRAAAVPDLRHPVRLEGVLRRRADAVRHPRGPPRRRLASPAVEGRHAGHRADAAAARVSAEDSSTTTAWRTTRATRWPWPARRSLPAASSVTRVRATGLRTDPRSGVLEALRAEDLTTGAELEIRTRSVVDATGVWAAEPDHPFKGALAPDPAQSRRASRRAAGADPRTRWA